MRIGSLFSGIGGLELGLEWAGVGHTAWQVEIDHKCRHWLADLWPDAIRCEDVQTVGAHNLEPVDLICGGFPCQDISYAGKGEGITGKRSGLWFEYARILAEMGPRYAIVENVRALTTRGLDAVLGTLADLGYDAEWHLLSVAQFGGHHKRERIFIIAWKRDMAHTDPMRELQPQGRVANIRRRTGNIGEELGNHNNRRREQHHESVGGLPVTIAPSQQLVNPIVTRLEGFAWNVCQRNKSRRVASEPNGSAPQTGTRVDWHDAIYVRGYDGTVRAVPACTEGVWAESPLWPVAHGVSGRVARLRAIGNAVSPVVAKAVGQRLLAIDRSLNTL